MFPLEFKFKYQKRKSAKEEKFAWFKDKLCFSLHWLTVIFVISASFFTGIPQTDVGAWNMTLHCDNEKFNQFLVPIDLKWPILNIAIVSVITVLLMSIKMLLCGPTSKDFLNIMYYFLGLVFCWDITFILRTMLSYPIPSFFQNEQLKRLYCCKFCTPPKVTKQLLRLDVDSRGSFPSFITSGGFYVTTFVFLLSCQFDDRERFAAKLLALFLPGSVSFVYSWYLWQYNENHLEDIIAGSVIGIFMAFYIAKDIFLKENELNRFTENFVSALIARDLQLCQLSPEENLNTEERNEPNQYTINLISTGEGQQEGYEDLPPPYSSLS